MATKVTKVTFPTLKEENISGLEKYLKELASRTNMEIKTWEKVPGRHAIAAYGRNIALVTLNKNGHFSVHLNEKMLTGKLAGSKIIKNGALSVYITQCDSVKTVVDLLQALVNARYDYAKDKTVTLVDVSKMTLVTSPTEKKNKSTKSATSKEKPTLVFKQIEHKPENAPA